MDLNIILLLEMKIQFYMNENVFPSPFVPVLKKTGARMDSRFGSFEASNWFVDSGHP
jgi:hypothetical protein